jgi:hypothetical protein
MRRTTHVSEITDTDIVVAQKIARRDWRRDDRFSDEDAFQEMMVWLLERKTEASPGIRGKGMRCAAVDASVESSYLMKISWATYSRNKGAPSRVKYTGLSTDVVGPEGVPEQYLANEEYGYHSSEAKVDAARMLSFLGDWDRQLVEKWASDPSSLKGSQYQRAKACIAWLSEWFAQEGEG